MSDDNLIFAEGYKRANCCKPVKDDSICGYYSYNGVMIVHKMDCPNLEKVEEARRVPLKWKDILDKPPETPDDDYTELKEIDFEILIHHQEYGVDYSLKVAKMLNRPKQDVFDSHSKLREMGLLSRVEKLIIQYRKGIVDNKWIKHRNHTYYQLTDRGELYLKYHLEKGG